MDDLVGKNLEVIGAALRDARVNAMRTQSEIGQAAGVSRQLVSRIEQGCNGEISAYIAVAAALQDCVRPMDTVARYGDVARQGWAQRVQTVQSAGMASVVDAVVARYIDLYSKVRARLARS